MRNMLPKQMPIETRTRAERFVRQGFERGEPGALKLPEAAQGELGSGDGVKAEQRVTVLREVFHYFSEIFRAGPRESGEVRNVVARGPITLERLAVTKIRRRSRARRGR